MTARAPAVEAWVNAAATAARGGQRDQARALLQRVVLVEEGHLQAWLWLAGLVEGEEEQRLCVEKVVALSLEAEGRPPGTRPVPPAVAAVLRLAPRSGPGPAWLPHEAGFEAFRRFEWPGSPGAAALGFLAGIALAELLVTFADLRLGLALHCLLLGSLLFGSARAGQKGERALLVSLAFAPLIRILSLSLPLTTFPLLYWYLLTSVPLFAALFVAAPTLGYSWRGLGLHLDGLPLQLAIGASGLLFGAVEYYILRPEPLAPALSWRQIWWPALVLVVSTGLLEEMIFRGLLQRAAGEALGRWGLAYVALLFAVLHTGYRSVVDVVFVLGVGLFLGWVVQRTRSLVGVTLAHGLTNVVLFLVMPFVAGG